MPSRSTESVSGTLLASHGHHNPYRLKIVKIPLKDYIQPVVRFTDSMVTFFVEHSSGGEDSMPGLSQGDFCGQLLPSREGDTREGES
jgi:hypothetical protein